MRRLEYFTVCQSVSLDAMTGEISLFHVTHHRIVAATPTTIPLLCVVGSFIDDEISIDEQNAADDNAEVHVKLNVISPGGEPVNTFRRTLNSAGRSAPHRKTTSSSSSTPSSIENTLFRVTNIPIPHAGDLVFELVVDDNPIAKHTVSVHEKAT